MGVMLELNVEDALPEVSFDPTRMRQALLNLLRNGQEAAGKGGTVRLTARRAGEKVRITVEDSGPGIGPEEQEQIFEPFFTTRASGTGLGLTLTREIITEHGGLVSVGDSQLGGAAFHLDLVANSNEPPILPEPKTPS